MYEANTEWRARRQKAKLSLREMARRSGLNRGTISRIERGWPATASQASALLAALAPPVISTVIGTDGEVA